MNGWEKNAVHYMKKNSVVRVKYIGEDNPLSLRYGKIYEAAFLSDWQKAVKELTEKTKGKSEIVDDIGKSF